MTSDDGTADDPGEDAGDDGVRYEAIYALGQDFPYEEPPDGPAPLGWAGHLDCLFCDGETVWQHDLTMRHRSYRTMYGDGMVWGGSLGLCVRCESLYEAGEYAELARLQTSTPPASDNELTDHLIAIAAFCRADRGARRMPEPDFPEGYRPLGELTGVGWLFDVWPVERRMVLADTQLGHPDADPDAVTQLVASPWPSLTLDDVFRALWRWVHRDRNRLDMAEMQAAEPGRAAELLRWPEEKMLGYLRSLEE